MKRPSKTAAASMGLANVTPLPVRGPRVGRVVAMCETGWLVQVTPDTAPLPARTTLMLDAATMRQAAACRQEALLMFENDTADRPIVVGLMAPVPVDPPVVEVSSTLDATMDGRRVTLEATDELVLRCGHASITLRRNGRVAIRGMYVETRAQGVNRIQGGSVRIN
jgi:Domain of unknown function (DUF6484)